MAVLAIAVLAAGLSLPAPASATTASLHRAKGQFAQAWRVVSNQYFVLTAEARAWVEACNNAAAISDPVARSDAFFQVGLGAVDARDHFDAFGSNRRTLERRAEAIGDSVHGLPPPQIPHVVEAESKLNKAIDFLLKTARSDLMVAMDLVVQKDCVAAGFSVDLGDLDFGKAIKKKNQAFRLI